MQVPTLPGVKKGGVKSVKVESSESDIEVTSDDAPPFMPSVSSGAPDSIEDEPPFKGPATEEVYKNVLDVDPDRAAKVIDYASQTEQHPALVDKNLEKFEKIMTSPGTSFFAEVEAKYPGTAKFLSDPQNMAVAKDDLENVRNLEGVAQEYGVMASAYDALNTGLASLYSSVAKVPALAYNTAAIPQNFIADKFDIPSLKASASYENPASKHYDEAAKFFSAQNQDLHNSIVEEASKGNIAKAGRAAFAQFVANFPNQALIAASTMAGFPGVALTGAAATSAADSASRPENMEAGPLVGTANALGRGSLEAAFERMGTVGLLKSWERALSKDLGKLGATEVIKAFGKQFAQSVIGEGMEEGATSLGQDFIDYSSGVNPEAMDGSIVRAIDAGIVGSVSGGFLTGPAGAVQAARIHSSQVRSAQLQKDFYTALGENIGESKVRERLPSKYRELVDQVTKGTPIENVYIPAEAFETYFQSRPGGLAAAVQELGIDPQFEEAKESGGLIKVPLSRWAEKIAGTEHYNALANDITFDPARFTVNESKELESKFKEADRLARENPSKLEVEDETAVKEVEKRLIEAGVDPSEAGSSAKLYRALNVMAKRSGKSLSDLMNYIPKINGLRAVGVPQNIANIEIDPTALQSEETAIQAFQHRSRADQFIDQKRAEISRIDGQVREMGPSPELEAQRQAALDSIEATERVLDRLPETETVLNQSATIRSGKETLEKYGLDPNSQHTVREVARALEARQRDIYGMIDPKDRSQDSKAKIANWMAEEIRFEMQNPNRSGVGWYSEKYQRALDVMGDKFPELKTDKDARNLMTALIAITSDGQKVMDNFKQAMAIYGHYKETGKFEAVIGNQRAASVRGNLEKLQGMIDKLGPVETHKYLMEERTVSELRALAKEVGEEFNTQYQAHIMMPRAAVTFGPKLGAFYANLMGAHGYLTMDRWWSRTFNRYRGILLTEPTKQGLARFKGLLGKPRMSDKKAIEATVKYRDAYAAKNYKNGTEIEKAANTIWKAAFDTLEDTPFNATDRTFMLETVNEAQKQLAKDGIHLSVADIQAALWYYEKRLYGELGGRESADISYEEAAAKLVRGDSGTAGDLSVQGRGEGESEDSREDARKLLEDEFFELWQSNDPRSGSGRGSDRQEADRRALQEDSEPLVGLPKSSPGPSVKIRKLAERHMQNMGLPVRRQGVHVVADPARGARIAEAYDQMKHDPNDPEVKAAYDALIKETLAQYQLVKEMGLKIEVITGNMPNPYPEGPKQVLEDMKNGHLWLFPTRDGFGTINKVSDNPLELYVTDETLEGYEHKLVANDVFRIVHDVFGHGKEGVGFGPSGEENAWQSHVRMYSPLAARAMTSETRGQNSWVNFGPYGDSNRANQKETVFADQKVGLLPEWVMTDGLAEDRLSWLNQGFSAFQAFDDANGPRGSIQIGNNKTFNINILKGADLSTFLHETGHLFLEMMGDLATEEGATDQIKSDYAEALKWLGVESRDQIKREHHEKWAEGFERYLMEGKAPSEGLRKVFAVFKTWLYWVYKSLKNMRVELTPEVRGVFDRMLATDEEIRAAMDTMSADVMIKDPRGAGMTESEAIAFEQVQQEARLAAEETVTAKAMEQVRLERSKLWKKERDSVKAKITEEVEGRPEQILLKILKTGKIEGRGDLPRIKLSREAVEAEFGKEFMKRLPKGIFGKDGMDHNILADLLAAGSGADMIEMLANAQDPKALIEELTDAEMRARHGQDDPLVNGTLSEEAIKAIHNDKRSELMRLELEWLAKNELGSMKKMIKKVARRVPSVAEVKARAQAMIMAKPIGEIKPYLYQRAESKAAKEALDHFLKGDFEKAFQAKEREFLNHELYRAATQAVEDVEKGETRFNKFFEKDDTLSKKRDMNIVNAGRAILARFGMGEADKDAASYVEAMQKYDPEGYASVIGLIQDATANAKNFGDLTFFEFVALKDTLQSIWDLSKRSRQILVGDKLEDKEEIKDKLRARIDEITKDKSKESDFNERADKLERKLSLLGAVSALRRVESWADAMDGGDPNGPFRRYIWTPISEGVDKYREQKNVYLKKLVDMLQAHAEGFDKTVINAPDLGGKKTRFLDKSELIGAMLHMGNESNLKKLLLGYEWGTVDEDGNLDTTRWDRFIIRLEEANIITKADYDFIQSVWDLNEELKPGAQKAHKEMYGFHFAEITSKGFSNKYGGYRGGYVPAVTDQLRVEDNAIRHEKEALETGADPSMFPAQNNGFTKGRVNYAAPLSLDLKLVPMHMDKVLRFTHISPRVKDVSRLVFDKGFRSDLKKLDPTVASDMLVPWLNRAAQQKVVTPSTGRAGRAADTFFRALRTRAGLQVMFANVSNTMQQATGLSIAALKVKPRYLKSALFNYIKSPSESAESISEKSLFMKNRLSNQTAEMNGAIQDILLQPSKFDKASEFFQKHGYFMQSAAQNVVDITVWMGAYDQAIEQGLEEADAIRAADSAVRLTQGSFAPEDVSRFETGTPFVRMFTMFYSYFNMQANLLGTEFQKVAQEMGLKKGAGRMLYIYALGFMIPAVLSDLIMRAMSGKGFDEEDDESYLDDFMAMFFGSQVRGATALVPVVGTTMNAVSSRFNDKQWDDRMSLSPAVTTLEAAVGAPADIYKMIAEGKDLNKQTIRDVVTAIGMASGFPAGSLSRPIGYLNDVSNGKAQPSGPIDFTRGLVTGKAGDNK